MSYKSRGEKWASYEKVSLKTTKDWDAYNCAVMAGLIHNEIEFIYDLPDTVFVWMYSGDDGVQYFPDEESARNCYEAAIDFWDEASKQDADKSAPN